MANSLGIDLKGKTVIVQGRKFLCENGFGIRSFTSGRAIYGKFLDTGEEGQISGYEVEKLAEEETKA